MRAQTRRQKKSSTNNAHVDLDVHIERKLRDPEFRAAYEAEDKRIDLIL